MPSLPRVSGAEVVRALERLGFHKVRQSGSHAIMRRGSKGCVVPTCLETRRHLFAGPAVAVRTPRMPRTSSGWLRLAGVTRNNLHGLDVAFPLGAFTSVTGVSGSGKSSLVSQALVELVAAHLGHEIPADPEEVDEHPLEGGPPVGGHIASGMDERS